MPGWMADVGITAAALGFEGMVGDEGKTGMAEFEFLNLQGSSFPTVSLLMSWDA